MYLDANATEPLRPEARAAAIAAMDLPGNPASVHGAGRAARGLLESCRRAVGRRFGAPVGGVVFTSGGTEADGLAIAGLGAGRRVIIGATEHDAIRAAGAGAAVVPVDGDGVIDLAALDALLREGGLALVCVMLANNETGRCSRSRRRRRSAGFTGRCCMSMRWRRPVESRSTWRRSGPIAWPCPDINWAGPRGRARWCWPMTGI